METEVLLDTHLLVWLYAGENERLSDKAKKTIEGATLLASPISILEIDFLHEVKKIAVKGQTVLQALEETMGLGIPNDSYFDVITEAGHVSWTRDPFDRLLVAHARLRGIPLLTKDAVLREHYGRCVW